MYVRKLDMGLVYVRTILGSGNACGNLHTCPQIGLILHHDATEDSNEAQLVVQEWCRSATVLPALHPNEGSLLVSA